MISMDKKYRTRDGRDVRLLCVDVPNAHHPVVGIIGDIIHAWTKGGKSFSECHQTPSDLIEYHEPDIRTIWVNVYEEGRETCCYDNEEEAKRGASPYAIAVAQPVTFEVKRS